MKKKMNKRYKGMKKAAVMGLCVGMSVVSMMPSYAGAFYMASGSNAGAFVSVETPSNVVTSLNMEMPSNVETPSNIEMPSESVVRLGTAGIQNRSASTGDLWAQWTGDMSFLSGERGDGTKEKPYQISTKEHLMGLSELAAMGMVIGESEGTYPGDYRGAYFKLVKDLDLGGMNWIPIGFYCSEADMYTGEVRPFTGSFDGNGKTISNFRLADPEWRNVGLFGAMEDAEIENLTVRPGFVMYGDENAGILAGSAKGCVIRNVNVSGTLRTDGTVGGLVGEVAEDSVIENCTADHIAMDSGDEKDVFAGGIVGKAAESLILDCVVNTGDSYTARIQGDGYVGGVVGFQNGTDIFNVHVMGTVGGSGSRSIGGVTGKYASGKLKVARFEGTIASSGLGSMAHEGTFIGTHDTGFHFRYGVEAGADVAYLFADSEGKIAAGVCGSGISDDNSFGYDAHIGFWHGNDNFFTLVQGQNTKAETERYFYEELENGMLHLIDTEEFVKEMTCAPDHFAPNAVGRPTRGYLVSVLQVDTAANVEQYYDVAVLTAKGESAYSKVLDKETRGAVAAGDVVTVLTAPNNTETEKYQMDGAPTYTDHMGKRVEMAYQVGGAYSFVMPAHDTEVSAVYEKVAADVRVIPEELKFRVVQTRTGNRKSPSIVTEVKDGTGKLIARYISDRLEEGTKVQEVTVEAVVDKNNDVADSRILWSVDDSDLLVLKRNGDEDSEGYTAQSASVELNLQAEFFQNIIEAAEEKQAAEQYRYAIPDTVYGNGTQGGLAVLTAKTRPSASFEGKPATANCRIPVTFQIKDETYVASEGAELDKKTLEFVVTRTLTGNRKTPVETITVTEPQILSAAFTPDYFDQKDVTWKVSDPALILVEGEEKTASVSAHMDAKWVKDLIAVDLEKHKNDWKTVQSGCGQKETSVTVIAEDLLGNSEYAVCDVVVRFETVDKTYLYGGGSSGSSGGSSSGGSLSGGSLSAGGQTLAGSTGVMNKTEGPGTALGSVSGTWEQTEDGRWKFWSGETVYLNRWAYVYNPYAGEGQSAADWFKFDENGYMLVGWQTDFDGNRYYLWPEKDGTQGHMVTGWNWIMGADGNERCYYFNPVSDGTRGRMYQNETTPDGYQVNEYGAWVVNGVEQVREKTAAGR